MEKAKNIEWRKIGRWKTPFLMEWMIIDSISRKRLKEVGFDIWFHNFLNLHGESYITQEDYDIYLNYYKERLKREGGVYFKKYSDLITRKGNEAIDFSIKVKKRRVNRESKEGLKRLFSQFLRKIEPNMGLAYTIQMVDEVLADALKERLMRYSARRADELFSRLTAPKEDAFMIKEMRDMINIAIADDAKKRGLLIKHMEEYSWMKSPNWNEPIYVLEYYSDRMEKIESPKRSLKEMMRKKEKQEKEIRDLIIKIEKKGIKVRNYINLIRTLVNIKMFNWDAISISGNNCRNLMAKIGDIAGINYYDVIELSPAEIYGILKGKGIHNKKMEERKECSGLLRVENRIYELDKGDVGDMKKYVGWILPVTDKFRGIPVSRGIVKGKVIIIMHSDSINKMKDGHVLVCPMTNPDYMPVIGKAKAIITDDGGVLCHAAIISREFKIPCIVGTRVATKVLKDGDLVEVDADKGIVRKLTKQARPVTTMR